MPHRGIPPTQPPGDRADELLAMVAHELRRPLTALLGALATLQQRGQALSTLQQQELLGMAYRQGEQLQRLLSQLLGAADVDRGQARLVRRSLVDAASLAEETGVAARLAHPDYTIAIEVAGPLLVRVDPLAISRILGNLLDNAAAYSPQVAAIQLSASRDGVHALLAVQDQGPGIPLTDRDQVFQRYARLDQPTASPVGGLGLGLYIARRLAHANRGQLQVTDSPGGRGARAELRLPLASSTPRMGSPIRRAAVIPSQHHTTSSTSAHGGRSARPTTAGRASLLLTRRCEPPGRSNRS
jgi:signal transduction histidine kinase